MFKSYSTLLLERICSITDSEINICTSKVIGDTEMSMYGMRAFLKMTGQISYELVHNVVNWEIETNSRNSQKNPASLNISKDKGSLGPQLFRPAMGRQVKTIHVCGLCECVGIQILTGTNEQYLLV